VLTWTARSSPPRIFKVFFYIEFHLPIAHTVGAARGGLVAVAGRAPWGSSLAHSSGWRRTCRRQQGAGASNRCPAPSHSHPDAAPRPTACEPRHPHALHPTPRPQGYRFYLIVFYVLVATLFVSTGICTWVGWCFKNDSFPFLWPIKVARIVVSLFVSMFYIASLNIFLIAMQCEPTLDADTGKKHWVHLIYHLGEGRGGGLVGGVKQRLSWRRACRACERQTCSQLALPPARRAASAHPPSRPPRPPPPDCLSMPHIIHAVFSLVSSVLFFVVALLLVIADHELEPMSRSLLAAPHSMTEIRMLLCKTAITFADILLRPAPHYQVTLYAVACVLMLWYQLRWVRRGAGWMGGRQQQLRHCARLACTPTAPGTVSPRPALPPHPLPHRPPRRPT
jgi:hypothetical protein